MTASSKNLLYFIAIFFSSKVSGSQGYLRYGYSAYDEPGFQAPMQKYNICARSRDQANKLCSGLEDRNIGGAYSGQQCDYFDDPGNKTLACFWPCDMESGDFLEDCTQIDPTYACFSGFYCASPIPARLRI